MRPPPGAPRAAHLIFDMPTVAAYVRVSSQSQTLAMQRDAIARAAKARGQDIAEWYAEKVPGGGARPPELRRLLDEARAGRHSHVYVYRLDRLSRRGIRDLFAIVEQLRDHGCHVVSLADGFDLDGPASEIVLAVLAWAAKMERHAIAERISAARARVEAEGGAWGRPSRMSLQLIDRARKLKEQGHTMRYIAAALKVPRATLARTLARWAASQKPGAKIVADGPRKAHPR
jgi:DNA invertase Pin-like site-specific DNA recombinase